MSVFSVKVHCGGGELLLCAGEDKSILELLTAASVIVDAPCGGRGTCGKCSVELRGAVRSRDSGETVQAEGRLHACRFIPAGDCELWLDTEGEARIVLPDAVRTDGGGEGLGLAVDIGTTTVAAALYDLATGECIAEKSERNAQRSFGADVVSRMEHCRRGSFTELAEATRTQLAALFEDREGIRRVALVGNTVMQHLAWGLDPSDMAVPPFRPKSLFGFSAGSELWQDAEVYLAPCVSAYVRGDVPAGMLACGMDSAEGLWLYVDIGTNGEMALGDKNGYVTCATAAGPAFEGAEIACGMIAAEGAVDRVWCEGTELFAHVIGGGEAKGICGSGLIDAAAAMLRLGVLDRRGRLLDEEKAPVQLRRRFIRHDGVRAFVLRDGVFVTAKDIRKIQLAKAAIRGGIETLLQGRVPDGVVIAGGFGSYIDVRNAVEIGLLPPIPVSLVRQAGNAAAKGAAMLLNDGTAERLKALTESCSYLDLSSSKEFSDSYISYLDF